MPLNSRKKISKRLSYYLRHNPKKIGMTLDDEGFSSITINELAMRMKIPVDTIIEIVETDPKGRFSIKDNRIRANFGHSHPVGRTIWEKKPPTSRQELPPLLYHGTRYRFWRRIREEGLKSRSRQFVHLSTTIEWAYLVGKRLVQNPIILAIDVEKALQSGATFWIASKSTVLATSISPECLKLIDDESRRKKASYD